MNNKEQQLEYLKKYFGFSIFRVGQESIVDAILKGEDVLGIMPTGGGKSLCYQLPALLFEGVTLVISPLISLMKDQVDGLLENAIPSTYINSSLTAAEFGKRMRGLENGEYKLCYVAPERLNAGDFLERVKGVSISLVAVDEAHCISQWGHDFRPSYKEIPAFIQKLPKRPIVAAFTATATHFVKDEIKALLELRTPHEVVTGFDRPNLFYTVAKPQNKSKYLIHYLEEIDADACGIVFCATRKTVDSVTRELSKRGYSVEGYHAGYGNEERKQIQENFMFDRTRIIVATNAFGMGIDKPDVRFVIHYNMPKNMEAYYQEAGRAGRDGQDSTCILLYSPADVVKQKLMIANNSELGGGERDDLLYSNLQTLVNYCHSPSCLRNEILGYFGETIVQDACGKCGNCTNESSLVDMTIEAQKVLSCVYRTNQRFGAGTIIKVLRGSKDQKIIDWQLDQQSTYGIMAEHSEGLIKEVIMHMIAQGYLAMKGGTYPVLALTEAARPLLKGEERFCLKQDRVEESKARGGKREKNRKSQSRGTGLGVESAVQEEVYDYLVALRKQIADQKRKPAYLIFSNATLLEMAEMMPVTREELLEIKGVGEKKYESYGAVFIEAIAAYKAKMRA